MKFPVRSLVHTNSETLWTVIPFLIAMTIFGWAAEGLFRPILAAEKRDGGLCRWQTVDVEDSTFHWPARDK